jgi:DNA replication protein DnaC
MTKRKGKLERPNPFVEAVADEIGVGVPAMTHEEVLESRRRLLASAPQPAKSLPPGVPKRYRNVRFATTDDRPEVKGFRAARKAAEQWAQDAVTGHGPMVALVGDTGTSKSHLACCAAWLLHEEYNLRAPFYSWYTMIEWLRQGRMDETEQGVREVPPHHVRQRLYATDLCIIDEVRPTSGTDFDAMELAKLAMQRYDENKAILITGNWASLADLIGAPAADRFTIITLDGPSYRKAGQ